MYNSQQSYKQILKTTSLFSGVQVFNIIAAILRSKFAALFIGPIGIGVLGVLNSTLNLITGITKLGLDSSAIKDIAIANTDNDKSKLSKIINTLKRLLWIFGIIGTLFTIILSSILSKIAFETTAYTFSFVWISIAVLFKQLTVANLAILQGLRNLKKLAQVNLCSSVASVIVALLFYYFFGIDGIIPTIVFTALLGFLIARYFSSSISYQKEYVSLKEALAHGKPMIKLGLTLGVGSLITLVTAYAIQIYIINTGGLTEVGFYNAGIIIINSYVGLLFEAMGKDYFPRLSEVINDAKSVKTSVYQQSTIAILLITPIIVLFLTFAEYVIRILYSKDFLPILVFLTFAIVATLFKAVSWTMGYVIIAKGDSKVFIKTAIGFNLLLFAMNVLGYKYSGLLGLGLSFVGYYFIHLIGIGLIMRLRYNFSFDTSFLKLYSICLLLVFAALLVTYMNNNVIKYGLFAVLILATVTFTIYNLNKRLDLISFFNDKLKK